VQLPSDVTAFASRSFPAPEQGVALSALAAARLHDGTEPDARMLRCALVGSRGSLDTLRVLIGMLAVDWRDVIMCGEYELQGNDTVRVRDLSKPLSAEV